MTLQTLLDRLDAVRSRGAGKWSARCPAHQDHSPSLSIRQGDDGRILVHCFAGCTALEICSELEVSVRDLFQVSPPSRRQHQPKPWRFNGDSIVFRFQLHALDLRVRAESILCTATGLSPSEWSDDDLQEALEVVWQAYADSERADLLEDVSHMIRARRLAKEYRHASRHRAA